MLGGAALVPMGTMPKGATLHRAMEMAHKERLH